VLREQLGPGELDAAARVCKAWAAQLADGVVHTDMALPASYERLLCPAGAAGQAVQECAQLARVAACRQ